MNRIAVYVIGFLSLIFALIRVCNTKEKDITQA